jgi:hypothetical protein
VTWNREFLNGPVGKGVAIVVAIVGLVAAFVTIKNSIMPSSVATERNRVFIDSATGLGFRHELVRGESVPVVAPSGGKTGYPAELCYWTREGTPKSKPTPVLLNTWIGKPEPTFCPDCGRLVIGNNPPARPGMTPPPTREEYEKRLVGVGPELLQSVAKDN